MAFVFCEERWRNPSPEKEAPQPFENQFPVSNIRSGTADLQKCKRIKQSPFPKQKKPEMDIAQLLSFPASKSINPFKKGKIYHTQTFHQSSNQEIHQPIEVPWNIVIKNHKTSLSNHEQKKQNKWANWMIKESISKNSAIKRKKVKVDQIKSRHSAIMIGKIRELQIQGIRQIEKQLNLRKNSSQGYMQLKKFYNRRSTTRNQRRTYESKRQQKQNVTDFRIDSFPINTEELVYRFQTAQIPFTECCEYFDGQSTRSPIIASTKNSETIQNQLQNSNNSMQFLEDSTPGPGSYDLGIQLKDRKSTPIQKFGVTSKRFQTNPPCYSSQMLNPQIPNFKKSSIVSAKKVGFGKSTKQNKNPEAKHPPFYQDVNNIEHKSLKSLCKKKSKIGFNSNLDRFTIQNAKPNFTGADFYYKQTQKSEMMRPQSVFISKVNRNMNPPCETEEVDFTGQQTYTIEEKQRKEIQFIKDLELITPPFLKKSERFVQFVIPNSEKVKEVKKEHLEQIKNRRYQDSKQIKAYTIAKNQTVHVEKVSIPAANKYQISQNWIKPSFNIKFQDKCDD